MRKVSNGPVLSTNISISIPNFVESFEEMEKYLVGIKGSPNSFNPSITAWKDKIGTPIGERVKRFLNGDKVFIPENQLTIIVSKKLIDCPEAAFEIVDQIFRGDHILINPKLNNYLPIKAEIDKVNYRIISQITEPNFFKFKEPVKIRVKFRTNLQLDTTISNISQEALDEGVSTAPYADFFKALKKYLNEPESVYFLEQPKENTYFSYENTSPMIISAPKTLEDLQKILFNEYLYRVPIDLENLGLMASIFGSQAKSRISKKIHGNLIPTYSCFGLEMEKGCSFIRILFPNGFDSIESFYNKLQILIEQMDNAQQFLKKTDILPNSHCRTFEQDGIGVQLIINYSKGTRPPHYYFNSYRPQPPISGINDPLVNFQKMKDAFTDILENCKSLAWFLGHEVMAYHKNRCVRIRRPEICDFLFSRILMDPMLFADCKNPYYEKISKMVMNI